jgi:release factor glutamine methyltransferase
MDSRARSLRGCSLPPGTWLCGNEHDVRHPGERSKTVTVGQHIDEATRRLTGAGCETPRADAIVLVAAALGTSPSELKRRHEDHLSGRAAEVLARHVQRRCQREPVQYILGRCRIFGIELGVDPRVFIPHPFSAPLIAFAIRAPAGTRIHDLGTGSGALALAIKAKRPDLAVTGSDLSPDAIVVATENARRLGLEVAFSVAPNLPRGTYDLVIANLPFQDAAGQTVELAPEYAHQPLAAIRAGDDGLNVIRNAVTGMPSGLTIALQHASSQAAAVRALLSDAKPLGTEIGWNSFTVGHVP